MGRFSKQYYKPYASRKLSVRYFVRNILKLTPKVRWLFDQVKSLPAGAKVVDVGCGTGGFLELMEQTNPGIETVGIDIGYPPSFSANGVFTQGSALQLPFADNSFDIVTCSHVIEHLLEPEVCVQELIRVCRPDGLIYIETPSPRSAWMPFFNIFWDDPTHIRPYSKIALKRLLEMVGTEVKVSGVKRSLPGLLLGFPYLIIGSLLGDRQAKAMFAIYTFGFSVYAGGVKPKPCS